MIFNFFLGNHFSGGLRGLPDLLLPIYHGLAEAGHHVVGYGLGLRPAPVVNVLVEFFHSDDFVDTLLAMKAQSGDGLICGVLCTEDMEDLLVMDDPQYPRRLPNLMRVLPAVDFVWTLLPQIPAYDKVCGPGKAALINYGFSPRYLHPRLHTDPATRDLDAIMYGSDNPYRRPVVEAVRQRGLNCLVSARHIFPSFATEDIVSRAKVVLDVRRGPGVRFPSPTRIARALHCGTAIVAERVGDASALADLLAYTVLCPYDEMAAYTEAIVRTNRFVELGLANLARFRSETSMAENMRRAMDLPVFRRLAG